VPTPEESAPAQPAVQQTASSAPWPAEKVAVAATIAEAANGIHYAAWGETRVGHSDLERLVGAVPRALAPAIAKRAYFFVPLVIAEGSGDTATVVAPGYSVDLGDRAVCHRNVTLKIQSGEVEGVFLVEAAGVPESFASLAWSQAQAGVRGETSQDAWETRRRALDPVTNAEGAAMPPPASFDERARKNYEESAFSDSLAIYMLSLSLDFDYHDLREREYPLLAAPSLAERLRHIATLFPANDGYDFQILYRRKGSPG